MTDVHPSPRLTPAPWPPGDAPAAKPAWVKPIGVGLAVLSGTIYTGLVDPNTSHAFPFCPLKAFTGLDCPACGCLRAVHSLTRANLVEAASHNLLFTLAAPFLVLGWMLWLARSLGVNIPRRPPVPSWLLWSGIALVAVFTITRNLPFPLGQWLNSTT